MKYKGNKKVIVYLITYWPKSTRFPLGDTAPLNNSHSPKISKKLSRRKNTTSKFCSPLNISRGSCPAIAPNHATILLKVSRAVNVISGCVILYKIGLVLHCPRRRFYLEN